MYPYYATGEVDNWQFDIVDGEAHITAYTGEYKANLNIPAFVRGEDEVIYPVSKIGVNCTKSSNIYGSDSQNWKELVNVVIPSTVKSIEPYTFYKCTNLKSIVFGEVEEIGDYAFYGCKSIKSITLPDSVNTIGVFAFRNCVRLATLNIGSGIETIKDYAFYECTRLVDVYLPSTIQKIYNNSFGCCNKLRTVTKVEPKTQFKDINETLLKEAKCLVIEDNEDIIDAYAFNTLPNLKEFVVSEKNTNFKSIDGLLYSKNGRKLIRCPAGYEGEVKLPSGVLEIGEYAFDNCNKVTSIRLNRSIRKIGNWAFAWCESLTSITIPQLTNTIGNYAFKNCTNLTKVVFSSAEGNGVTKIGNYAFEFCSSLSEVVLPDTLKTVGTYAFANCTSLSHIAMPASLTKFSSGMFRNSGLESIELPTSEEFTNIPFNTFGFCNKLTTVYIPANIKTVGSHAFSWCDNLRLVTFASSNTTSATTSFSRTSKAVKLDFVVEG